MTHWTEAVFVEESDLFLPALQRRVDDADEEVEALLSLLADEHDLHPETVLDVACGVGRHAVALAACGATVEGVDLSPDYVERARERAADAGVADRTAFRQGDMRDLGEWSERFDLLVSMWTAFGYFDDETNDAVLAAMHDRLAPGGGLVLELANKEGVLAEFDDDTVSEDDGRRTVETRDYDPGTSRLRTVGRVYDADTEAFRGTYEFDLRVYAPVELRRRCERAGFSRVSTYAGLDGDPLARDSGRLVVVAER